MLSAAKAREVSPVMRGRHRRRDPLIRRDPRRFARGIVRVHALPELAKTQGSDARFFAHSFAGAFLFVSLLIA
jgi:hypothetical protein